MSGLCSVAEFWSMSVIGVSRVYHSSMMVSFNLDATTESERERESVLSGPPPVFGRLSRSIYFVLNCRSVHAFSNVANDALGHARDHDPTIGSAHRSSCAWTIRWPVRRPVLVISGVYASSD